MRLGFSLLMLLLISACGQEADTGPGEVRWDREICVRCAMAVSDHNYSAQIRQAIPGQRSKLYKFDDLGCAVIWLDGQPWKKDAGVEIWVTDYRNGDWIDARKAHYITDRITPMNYGLGAMPAPDAAASGQQVLDFAQARQLIYQVEEKYQLHTGSDEHHPNAAVE